MIRTRDELPDLLNWMNLTGWGAEIGVYRGQFAATIMERWKGKQLFLVDCWRQQAAGVYHDLHNYGDGQWKEILADAAKRLEKYKDRVAFRQGLSVEIVQLFSHECLDFVYIDANHRYTAVLEDLHWWSRRVRKGGIIAGHDYLNRITPGVTIEVKRAVDEFFKDCPIYVTKEEFPTWMVLKQ